MHLSDLFEQNEPQTKDAILRDMLSRANVAVVRKWLLANGADEADLATDEGFLHEFAYWLEQEHSITVQDGMVEFYRLWNATTGRLIGDNPIRLYHFTSSARLRSIRKHGLVATKRSVNRTETAGVYLTTETGGPAVTGYTRNALRGTTKAYPVRLDIRTWLSQVEPDPDDADISSGQTQFITDYVPPQQIIAVNRF